LRGFELLQEVQHGIKFPNGSRGVGGEKGGRTMFQMFAYFAGEETEVEYELETLEAVLALSNRLWANHKTTGLEQVCFAGCHTDTDGVYREWDGHDLDTTYASTEAFLAEYDAMMAEENAYDASLDAAEGRWFAGSAFGNRGLADYYGLELDEP
jgi:hypothetical protein